MRPKPDLIVEIFVPDGFELTNLSLRSVRDGTIECYQVTGSVATQVDSISVVAYSPDPQTQGDAEEEEDPEADEDQSLSSQTGIGHSQFNDNAYTPVCGIYSIEIEAPVRKINTGNGVFVCPRCRSNFTRVKTAKDHFHGCILKYGNPDSLKFTDHPSMARTEQMITARRFRAGLRANDMDTEEEDGEQEEDEGEQEEESGEDDHDEDDEYIEGEEDAEGDEDES